MDCLLIIFKVEFDNASNELVSPVQSLDRKQGNDDVPKLVELQIAPIRSKQHRLKVAPAALDGRVKGKTNCGIK